MTPNPSPILINTSNPVQYPVPGTVPGTGYGTRRVGWARPESRTRKVKVDKTVERLAKRSSAPFQSGRRRKEKKNDKLYSKKIHTFHTFKLSPNVFGAI
jgi:hypothetical protein